MLALDGEDRASPLCGTKWHWDKCFSLYRVTQKKRELLKTPTKIEEIEEKKILTEIEPLQLAF